MTHDTEMNIAAVVVVACVPLAVPRRTRAFAAFLYGFALSRAHGAGRDKLREEVGEVVSRLFSEKTSVGKRVDELEPRVAELERRQGGSGLIA